MPAVETASAPVRSRNAIEHDALTSGEESADNGHMATLLAVPGARVAFGAFNRLCDRWKLPAAQRTILLGRSGRTAYRYAESATPLSPDVRERISLLLGIYDDVRSLFGSGSAADAWIRHPNRDFGGNAPLDRMLTGKISDLVVVRRYLAVARQGVVPESA